MKYLIKLVDNHTHITHFEGAAIRHELKNDGFEMVFSNDKYQFSWKIYEKGLVIQSISDITVHLILRENVQTKGHIDTVYGQIPLTCQTSMYRKYNDRIEVKYKLIQGDQSQNFHFILYISEGENHVH